MYHLKSRSTGKTFGAYATRKAAKADIEDGTTDWVVEEKVLSVQHLEAASNRAVQMAGYLKEAHNRLLEHIRNGNFTAALKLDAKIKEQQEGLNQITAGIRRDVQAHKERLGIG